MADPIPAADLPLVTPGSSDTVVGVDESTGAARRFLATELGAAAVAASNAVVGTATRKYKAIACVIRQDSAGSGWYFIEDTNHSPVGVTSVAADSGGTLTVTFNFSGTKVGTLNITPDEGYAATGIAVGASVGKTTATFTFYAPFELRISNQGTAWGNYITEDGGFAADFSTASSDGKVTVTHPAMTHTDTAGPAVLIEKYRPAGTSNGNAEIVVTTHGKSSFVLQAMEPIAGKIATNGSGDVTVTSELVSAPTTSWNSTSNRLEITHPRSTSVSGFSVTPMTGNYRCVVEASTDSKLEVAFYDSTNTKYTGSTPPASTTFVFTRPGNAEGVWSAQNRLIVRRGMVQVRAQDVQGAGSNFWIQGVMEVA